MKKILGYLLFAVIIGSIGFAMWTWMPTPPTNADGTEDHRTLDDYLNEGRTPGDTYDNGR